ncbi:MAG: MBOAT family protein [Spirochaetaceae bacterium]|nr:MBOAT family protein [Spirochaetaceae bacterium]
MLFNSVQFFVFFPIVAVLYFICTHKIHNNLLSRIILLVASLFFYACWNPAYLLLILTSVVVTWTSGLLMEKASESVLKKKLILTASLVINLLILFFFKYYGFFTDTVQFICSKFGTQAKIPSFSVLLPVGISFYTFQALGYSIDVYRGTVKAEHSFITYALFVTFFPQLVAGPIERSCNLLPQFKVDHNFDYDRVTDGLKLMAYGLFKKVVVAGQLAQYTDIVYTNIAGSSGTAIAIATVFFAFQILCDFSGYSDIAIGTAQVLGFKLMRNFERPYFSKSIAEFWRRWHISLSTWFKDYVYIPLGGSRCGTIRRCFNLFVTFLISGLWHGAAFHFVLWGAIHGLYQVVGVITKPFCTVVLSRVGIVSEDGKTKRWWQFIQVAFTFVLVCFAWIFFRASTTADALLAARKVFLFPKEIIQSVTGLLNGTIGFGEGFFRPYTLGLYKRTLALFVFLIVVIIIVSLLTRNKTGCEVIRKKSAPIRWGLYYAVVAAVLYFAVDAGFFEASEFIYFQF